jgi:hypothetical protein
MNSCKGGWKYTSTCSWPQHYMDMSGQIGALSASYPGKVSKFQLNKTLRGHQVLYERSDQKTKVYPYREPNPFPFTQLVTLLIEFFLFTLLIHVTCHNIFDSVELLNFRNVWKNHKLSLPLVLALISLRLRTFAVVQEMRLTALLEAYVNRRTFIKMQHFYFLSASVLSNYNHIKIFLVCSSNSNPK